MVIMGITTINKTNTIDSYKSSSPLYLHLHTKEQLVRSGAFRVLVCLPGKQMEIFLIISLSQLMLDLRVMKSILGIVRGNDAS